VPPEAPIVRVTRATHNSIGFRWRIDDNGGAPLLGHIVHLKMNQEWVEHHINRISRTHVLKGLSCGTQYVVSLYIFDLAENWSISNANLNRMKKEFDFLRDYGLTGLSVECFFKGLQFDCFLSRIFFEGMGFDWFLSRIFFEGIGF